jgi:adenosylcobinamide-GDP ribazoletransferase
VVLTAVRGALGFCSRLPVGRSEAAWAAFRSAPVAFPLAGYLLGVLLALPVGLALALGLPGPVVAVAYLLAVVAVSGVNHADGVADLGDAAAVHGTAAERRDVMKDTTVGVGAVLALGVVLVGLVLGALALAEVEGGPPGAVGLAAALRPVGLVVAAEVAAKLGMATVAAVGTASHEGLGAQFTSRAGAAQVAGPVVVALPAALFAFPTLAGLGALVGGVGTALALTWWADSRLDGVGGDVFGATNELGRVVALHLGVVVWVLG